MKILSSVVVLSLLAACAVQEGQAVIDNPFAGPGWDDQAKEPLNRDRPTYIVAATHLTVKNVPAAHAKFVDVFAPIRELFESGKLQGFVGYGTRTHWTFQEDWTISVWETEEDMVAFVLSEEHQRAIREMREHSEEAVVTHWEVPREALPVAWETVLEKIQQQGRQGY